ncbi:hypothetical protein Q5425_26425 [Amycolatopsis sp. A133]|uniref:hypothetical protein n=1 Tax=Amycolatopsis sp. A133 TaxID=3064472 RepID=UPI0027E785B3|nr:hypothetical protein [Amycolatopsis sp. A133]MDQ7807287.1 hypothetical protein [Amycolatopsis sp. A133]
MSDLPRMVEVFSDPRTPARAPTEDLLLLGGAAIDKASADNMIREITNRFGKVFRHVGGDGVERVLIQAHG